MIYILHLDSPLHHALHYVGFSTDERTLAARIKHHRRGTANCRFTEVLRERGIGFTVARVMEGDRTMERKLKRTKSIRDYCTICAEKEGRKAREYHPKEQVQ